MTPRLSLRKNVACGERQVDLAARAAERGAAAVGLVPTARLGGARLLGEEEGAAVRAEARARAPSRGSRTRPRMRAETDL